MELFYRYVRFGVFRCAKNWRACDWFATAGLVSFWLLVILLQVAR